MGRLVWVGRNRYVNVGTLLLSKRYLVFTI